MDLRSQEDFSGNVSVKKLMRQEEGIIEEVFKKASRSEGHRYRS